MQKLYQVLKYMSGPFYLKLLKNLSMQFTSIFHVFKEEKLKKPRIYPSSSVNYNSAITYLTEIQIHQNKT